MNIKERLNITILSVLTILFCGSFNSAFPQTKPNDSRETPTGCEYMRHALDYVLIDAKNDENLNVILITYLGNKEFLRNLRQIRIKNIETFLEVGNPDLKQIIIAEGKRRYGLGKIEIYLRGKLEWELFFGKNKAVCAQ